MQKTRKLDLFHLSKAIEDMKRKLICKSELLFIKAYNVKHLF